MHVPLTLGRPEVPIEHEGILFGRENQPVLADQLARQAHTGYGVVARQDIAVGPIRGQQQQEEQRRLHASASQRRPQAISANRRVARQRSRGRLRTPI